MRKNYLKYLQTQENESIIRVMAFMSYNPSIGRVLEHGGVNVFQDMAVKYIKKLTKIKTKKGFDCFHSKWVNDIKDEIKTNVLKQCSYGQAQKAINVFLKLYVYWANLPDKKIAKLIVPFLHVPLDHIMMSSLKEKFPVFFKNIRIIRGSEKNYGHSLSKVKKKEYDTWQSFFRKKYNVKPILFDTIWAIERKKD